MHDGKYYILLKKIA